GEQRPNPGEPCPRPHETARLDRRSSLAQRRLRLASLSEADVGLGQIEWYVPEPVARASSGQARLRRLEASGGLLEAGVGKQGAPEMQLVVRIRAIGDQQLALLGVPPCRLHLGANGDRLLPPPLLADLLGQRKSFCRPGLRAVDSTGRELQRGAGEQAVAQRRHVAGGARLAEGEVAEPAAL